MQDNTANYVENNLSENGLFASDISEGQEFVLKKVDQEIELFHIKTKKLDQEVLVAKQQFDLLQTDIKKIEKFAENFESEVEDITKRLKSGEIDEVQAQEELTILYKQANKNQADYDIKVSKIPSLKNIFMNTEDYQFYDDDGNYIGTQ